MSVASSHIQGHLDFTVSSAPVYSHRVISVLWGENQAANAHILHGRISV